MFDLIYELFLKTDGKPDSDDHLKDYINFVIGHKYDGCEYSEYHHILPRSNYAQYKHEEWNIVRLKYSDHIKAHELLFTAYNCRTYQYTLNFMASTVNKNHELLSNASKNAWKKIKNNKTTYDNWRKAKSKYMSSLSSEEQSRRSKLGWSRLDEESYKERCKINKNNWTDELKEQKSKSMKEYFENNPNEASRRMYLRYENMDHETLEAFKEKMDNVNKDPIKRNKASKSLKKLWNDDQFKEKMKKRAKKPGDKYKLIDPDGNILFRQGLGKLVDEFNFNITLVRKFTNTNKPVAFSGKRKPNQKTINTIGWIFTKLK